MLCNPAAHGHPGLPGHHDLPAIRRYRVRFEGYQGQADLICPELFALHDTSGPRAKPLDADLTARLMNLPVTDPDGRAMTIGELLYEAAETHLDHRHPEWTAAEGTFGTININLAPRLRLSGTITRRRVTLVSSRL